MDQRKAPTANEERTKKRVTHKNMKIGHLGAVILSTLSKNFNLAIPCGLGLPTVLTEVRLWIISPHPMRGWEGNKPEAWQSGIDVVAPLWGDH